MICQRRSWLSRLTCPWFDLTGVARWVMGQASPFCRWSSTFQVPIKCQSMTAISNEQQAMDHQVETYREVPGWLWANAAAGDSEDRGERERWSGGTDAVAGEQATATRWQQEPSGPGAGGSLEHSATWVTPLNDEILPAAAWNTGQKEKSVAWLSFRHCGSTLQRPGHQLKKRNRSKTVPSPAPFRVVFGISICWRPFRGLWNASVRFPFAEQNSFRFRTHKFASNWSKSSHHIGCSTRLTESIHFLIKQTNKNY